ncbi:fermentation associated protein [Gigaspora margarita]|uniref:Fermentation associated protein n=1 Tax=Gigaspora margarita TaxID=4874 RepID=A0A8H4AK23_GIGMA|nr:fermentation associated protein [Gigaspora margarita]
MLFDQTQNLYHLAQLQGNLKFLIQFWNITVRFGVEQIGINVNPDMLAFAKHWLKVHRIFRSKFESLELSTTLTQDTLQVKENTITIEYLCSRGNVIKKISITASAQKLIAFTNINTSIWLHNPKTLSSAEKSELENVSVNKSTAHPVPFLQVCYHLNLNQLRYYFCINLS